LTRAKSAHVNLFENLGEFIMGKKCLKREVKVIREGMAAFE
jgi:hypothetical protein